MLRSEAFWQRQTTQKFLLIIESEGSVLVIVGNNSHSQSFQKHKLL